MVRFERILCPTDFSSASLEALPCAVELARKFDSEITLMHVLHILPTPPAHFGFRSELMELSTALYQDADKQLDDVAREIPDSIPVKKILVEGPPGEEILRAIESHQIDLVTIATHGHTGWRHLVFGSVAERVVRAAKVPVLTVSVKGKEVRADSRQDGQ